MADMIIVITGMIAQMCRYTSSEYLNRISENSKIFTQGPFGVKFLYIFLPENGSTVWD